MERDFANLDRLQREEPNTNVIALEGRILFAYKTVKCGFFLQVNENHRLSPGK